MELTALIFGEHESLGEKHSLCLVGFELYYPIGHAQSRLGTKLCEQQSGHGGSQDFVA